VRKPLGFHAWKIGQVSSFVCGPSGIGAVRFGTRFIDRHCCRADIERGNQRKQYYIKSFLFVLVFLRGHGPVDTTKQH
jgi:hypothetical protein